MPTLLIEMPSGAAGDMLLAALIDLGADPAAISAALGGLGVGTLTVCAESVKPGGIVATRVSIDVPQDATWDPTGGHTHEHEHEPHAHDHSHTHEPHGHSHDGHQHSHAHESHDHSHTHEHAHTHRPYRAIRELLAAADLPERVIERAQRSFRLLAEAEGKAHGVTPDEVHFHEVGSLDAIADVVGVCLALEQLDIDRVVAGPLTLGSGTVWCAHGRMPVPVPAVVHMLATTGAPQRRIDRETGELTTPTGCALVCSLADSFEPSTAGGIQGVGYGAGHKDIPGLVNLLRVSCCDGGASDRDHVVELRCQLDDASGETLGAAIDGLMAAGARDAYLTPIMMKKGRPGHELTVLCDTTERDRLADWILTNTPTIGLRYSVQQRRVLPRERASVELDGHTVQLKVVTLPDGSRRAKPEADDLAAAAAALGQPLDALRQQALRAWQDQA